MSVERACVTCDFWEQKNFHKKARNAGLCRINPPVKINGDDHEWYWPETYDEDWCGEWTLKETERG